VLNNCKSLRLSEVISALSYSLDLTEGQPLGHCVRSCWLGTNLAKSMGFKNEALSDIYYTILLKDAGCSSNAERIVELYGHDDLEFKSDFKRINTESLSHIAAFAMKHTAQGGSIRNKIGKVVDLALHGHEYSKELFSTRCERGADIALEMGFNEAVADGIRFLDEHWNGQGQPYQRQGDEIPITSQIALLSQVIDVFFQVDGKDSAINEIQSRRETWFSNELVDAFMQLSSDQSVWEMLNDKGVDEAVVELEPLAVCVEIDDDRLDKIANSFSHVVDAKSHFTYGHSSRVAFYTSVIAKRLGYSEQRIRWLNRGALLHDLGKLGVSNTILDKPDKLDDKEWHSVRRHPELGEEILQRISAFADVAFIAGQHHERIDGKGYPLGMSGDDISLDVRIVTVADVFDAISAERPYRKAMPIDKVMDIMWKSCDSAFDRRCLQALEDGLDEITSVVNEATL